MAAKVRSSCKLLSGRDSVCARVVWRSERKFSVTRNSQLR